jgi:hypothetical protein
MTVDVQNDNIGTSNEQERPGLEQMDAGHKPIHIHNSQETICLRSDYVLSLSKE